MKKLLAISTRSTDVSYEIRDSLSQDWHNFLKKVIPDFAWVMLPNSPENTRILCEQNIFDGIVLSGGDDIGKYKGRDLSEIILLNYAIKNALPLIGICRGAQMINYYFGGKINKVNSKIHVAQRHRMNFISSFYSQEMTEEVNSYHNYGIYSSQLARPLIPFAFTGGDNTVEAFYHCALPLYGILWHPEREAVISNWDKIFFQKIMRK